MLGSGSGWVFVCLVVIVLPVSHLRGDADILRCFSSNRRSRERAVVQGVWDYSH